ncbi:MAG: STAS/SEC14 domain-containing protein [Desulforhopalus sp.]
MITHELLTDKGILIVTPEGPLEENDFKELANVVDPHIESKESLHGLMIYTETFPGWNSFAGLVQHFKFVKDHHRSIKKIAAVTDSKFLSIIPHLADHFIKAEIRHFDYSDKEIAFTWLSEDSL